MPENRGVALWLLTCCAMVVVMVSLGGLTRLTHSGLSMVEWDPIIGIVPPLSDSDWQAAFAKYRLTPEYLKVNAGMDLAGFRAIFWLEYVHRVWGRLIGLVFLLPFLWFWLTGRIGRTLVPRLIALFALGAAQGGLGWFMVKSGLVDDPAVSPYRLTAHLGLAVLIHALMLWTALDLWGGTHRYHPRNAGWIGTWLGAVIALVAATMAFGGLVAGLRAGLIYNTWPLMEGGLVPDGLMPAGWSSLFEDIKTVQFIHRCLAEITGLVVLGGWVLARRRRLAVIDAVAGMAVLQVGLGIATLVLVVPVAVAAAHQLGAVLLLSAALWARHRVRA